jgi:hypothetical protein
VEAVEAAKRGASIFPLAAGGKVPPKGSRGFYEATADLDAVEDSWTAAPESNIGFGLDFGGRHLVALDEDTPGALAGWCAAHDATLPATATVRTPRGGRHLLYDLGDVVPTGQPDLCAGVNVRAAGKGYTLLPPSRVNGAAYTWEVAPWQFTPAPNWLVDHVTRSRPGVEDAGPELHPIPQDTRHPTIVDKVARWRSLRHVPRELAEAGAFRLRDLSPGERRISDQEVRKIVAYYYDGNKDGAPLPPDAAASVVTLAELLLNPDALRPPPAQAPRITWRERLSVLAGHPKEGKSTLATAAAAAITRGRRFLDGTAELGTVLWFSLEESAFDIAERFRRFHADPARVLLLRSTPADPMAVLVAIVEKYHPDLIIIDSLSVFAARCGVSESGATQQWTALLDKLLALVHVEGGPAMLLLHHARKNDGRYRDASSIAAAADWLAEMGKDQYDPRARVLTVMSRFGAESFAWRLADDGEDAELGAASGHTGLAGAVLRHVKANPGLSRNKIVEAVKARAAAVDEALALLIDGGDVRTEPGPKRSTLHYPGAD